MLNSQMQDTYEHWIDRLPTDDPLRAELVAIQGDEKELTDRFYQEIVFGTAGLRFTMTDGSWFAMRPSGTEPKIKFYYYAVTADPAVSAATVRQLAAAVEEEINTIE